jgi:nucleotide-binding universal stress UspA family protein
MFRFALRDLRRSFLLGAKQDLVLTKEKTMATTPMHRAVESYLAQLAGGRTTPLAATAELTRHPATADLERVAQSDAAGTRFGRILVAVDCDNHPAVRAAIDIASPLHAQIAVVSVLEPLISTNADMGYEIRELYEANRASTMETLENSRREIPPELLAFTCLREGHATSQILAVADEFKADLIIMGTHRRGMLASFFMGSVSKAVLRDAKCPVMLVTGNPAHSNAPRTSHDVEPRAIETPMPALMP